ncbi:MAG: 2,4-dihydroxyhept-2-ene-1,7-dioic acid aldolase [Desulfobacteraceae bacterium]|nr:MAG: 2,4-dihydroxyhept-2-ene-1,7-dioic acid aldolase [Desulfobacteraceae bacterium]
MQQQMPFENRIKHMLKDGKKTAGCWLGMGSPISAEIMARAGFDWVIIDMEHGPGDNMTLISQFQALNGSNTLPIVRVPWNDFVMIKRVLDAGAYGILVPYINTKEEAEAAVRACKYPPEGIRGIAGSTRAAWFNRNAMNYFSRANDEILIIVQIETRTAVENLDGILSVPGVDGIFVGPMDLATSLGHIYNPGVPEVQSVILSIEEKVNQTDKFMGTISANWRQARELYERGYRLVSLMADGNALAAVAADKIDEFRKEFPQG